MMTMTYEEAVKRFPALENPPCLRETKYGLTTCGHCMTARSVLAGTRYIVADKVLSIEDAIDHLMGICTGASQEAQERVIVKEIRRDGQRILRPGTNVWVQLKRKPGTKRNDGHVVECYQGDLVKVDLGLHFQVVVPADKFVVARQGTTRVHK